MFIFIQNKLNFSVELSVYIKSTQGTVFFLFHSILRADGSIIPSVMKSCQASTGCTAKAYLGIVSLLPGLAVDGSE